MLTEDYHLALQMMEMKFAEQVREAETRRLIRHMGGGQSAWLVCSACWLLRRMGHALVSLGQWLQRNAATRSPILD